MHRSQAFPYSIIVCIHYAILATTIAAPLGFNLFLFFFSHVIFLDNHYCSHRLFAHFKSHSKVHGVYAPSCDNEHCSFVVPYYVALSSALYHSFVFSFFQCFFFIWVELLFCSIFSYPIHKIFTIHALVLWIHFHCEEKRFALTMVSSANSITNDNNKNWTKLPYK